MYTSLMVFRQSNMHSTLVPVSSTGPKCFLNGLNFQTINHIKSVPLEILPYLNSTKTGMEIIFYSGAKNLGPALYISQFLVRHKNLDQLKIFWDL